MMDACWGGRLGGRVVGVGREEVWLRLRFGKGEEKWMGLERSCFGARLFWG